MKTAALPQELATRADEVRLTVSGNLDAMLKQQRWSRRAVAAELGLTHTYVNSRVAGDTDLSASDLQMFATFLDVPVATFFEPLPINEGNVTRIGTISRPGNGAGRRSLYLLDGVGPAGIEPTTSTVESYQSDADEHLAPVTDIFGARAS